MSKLSRSPANDTGRLTSMMGPMETIIRDRGSDLVSDDAASFVISSESISDVQYANIKTEFDGIAAEINGIAEEYDITLTPQQKEAGTIVAMASKNPMEYHNLAVGFEKKDFGPNVNVVDAIVDGEHGAIDYRTEVGVEAFDERDLRNQIAASTVYNIAAAKQEDFGETFYPTIVLTPDQVGLELTIMATMVHKEIRRKGTGEVTDFDKKNLIEATADHTILESYATKIIPYFNPNGTNSDKFVDEKLLPPREIEVDGVPVRTSALAMGVSMDLLGLSQGPGILNGEVLDSTDSLDSRIGLSNLYLTVGKGDDVVVVVFNVLNLPRSLYNKSTEGMGYEMELNFRTDAVALHSGTKDKDGANVADTITGLESYKLAFRCVLTGSANVETGYLDVHTTKLMVDSVFDSDGNKIATSDPGYIAAFDGVEYELVGYDVDAARTNTNLRTRGMILDTDTITEAYKVGLGAPISVPAPVSSSGRTGVDLKSLIAAVRTRTSNNAVTALLNFVSRMRLYSQSLNNDDPVRAVEGIARHLILPVFIEQTLDLREIVDSESSSDKAEDIRAAIVEVLRYAAYRMVVDSNYQTAIDFDTGGAGKTPKLLIGTDPVTARYIIEFGDDRTMADTFKDFKITTTTDIRMIDKIIMSFTRDGADADPLSFGSHVYVPELTSTVQVTRNGSTTKENQVQPRDVHINHLPIVAVIHVVGLKEIIESKVPLVTV